MRTDGSPTDVVSYKNIDQEIVEILSLILLAEVDLW